MHLPFKSYGGMLKSAFAWYERIGRLLYPGELRADGTMSDPGRRRAAFVRSLRVRVSVAAQQGNLMYWRKKGAAVCTHEEAIGWWQ